MAGGRLVSRALRGAAKGFKLPSGRTMTAPKLPAYEDVIGKSMEKTRRRNLEYEQQLGTPGSETDKKRRKKMNDALDRFTATEKLLAKGGRQALRRRKKS